MAVPLSFTLKSIQQMMGRPTPITWNHRVLLIEEHGEKSYCIHEVHYDQHSNLVAARKLASPGCLNISSLAMGTLASRRAA